MAAPVVVVGPTAAGKSDVAMAAARAVAGTEIVAVDAMQVYRGMDIGTAKPSADDRAEVRHHCLDLVEPDVEFTVTDYQRAFEAAVAGIRRPAAAGRRHRAVPHGGDRPSRPAGAVAGDPRSRWSRKRRATLWPRLLERDPVAAGRIEPGNRRRVVRALEVCLGSGRPFSSFGPGVGSYPPTDAVIIGVRWPRPRLAARIERRVAAMIAAGLVDEVARLAGRGFSRTARQALGYKELLDHLDGRISLDEAVAAVVVRTRQFAVRQERWFRRDPRVRWYDIDRDPVSEVAPAVVDALRP